MLIHSIVANNAIQMHSIVRKLSMNANNALKALPVIKIPKYLTEKMSKIRYKEEAKAKRMVLNNNKYSAKRSGDKNILIISGKNKNYNHYFGQKYINKDKIPLISHKWIKSATNGERMQFHIYDSNPAQLRDQSNRELRFGSTGLNASVCDAIESLGLREPTAIQMAAIPDILHYKNMICSAETGSGKTIAYLAPIIQMIRDFKQLKSEQTNHRFPRGLVVVPSRELAEQVGRVAQHLAAYCGIGVAVMIGGIPKHITHTGMDLVISTIGLVQPLVNKGVYSLNRLNHIVIDESDTLFDDTFSFDVLDLLQRVLIRDNVEEDNVEQFGTQLVCVSATMPRNLEESLGTVVDLENVERITSGGLHYIMPHVKQVFYRIHKYERQTKLLELVKKDYNIGNPVMIFSNRSDSSNWIYHYLNENGVKCLRLNKDVSDEERYDQFNRFQEGECDVISCTDLGSRGLDTTRVKHVINYDCPHYVSDYIHRSGRTGRIGADNDCLVSTFVCFKPDVFMVQQLEMALRLNKSIDYVNANIKQQIHTHFDAKQQTIKGRKRTKN